MSDLFPSLLATYIHDINPVIFKISGGFALRWYGLAYLGGFIAGYYLLKYLSAKRLYPVTQDKLGDFVTYVAIFGVLIGGRLGYILFYYIPNGGWDLFMKDPWITFRVWEGGMASHGGIIGVLLFTLYYAIRHHLNWTALTDGLAIAAPVGIFFGRMANFINGELYGSLTPPGSSKGMKFPGELIESQKLTYTALTRIYEECPDSVLEQVAPLPEAANQYGAEWMIARVRDTPEIKEIVGSVLPERYPSQLYEALAEGLVPFAILWFVRIKFPQAFTGIFCCLFCLLYATGRIIVENFREPDSPVWMNMTRGQFLSLFLIVLGIAFGIHALRRKKTVADDMPK